MVVVAPRCGADYQSRISGPLLDRIDLHVEVAAVSPTDLALPSTGESSAVVAARVDRARTIQKARYAGEGKGVAIRTNAEADGALLERVAAPDAAGRELLDGALSPVAGVLPAAVHASARNLGLICPAAQGGEAAWAAGIPILAAPSLLALVNHFKGTQVLASPAPSHLAA